MQALLLEELLRGALDFKQLENLLWQGSLYLFQHLMVKILEAFDKKLMVNRDKSRYKVKEMNSRTVQTLVGEIVFKRRYYWDHQEEQWVYLLDDALGLEQEKTIGPGLLRLAVTWATKGPSYRDARDRLTDLYGAQVLSHEAIRQALIDVGAFSERDLENKIIKEQGKRTVDALFIEVDGFGARIQKNKKLHRRNRYREVKLAVIHEGWAPRTNGKKPDYHLINPIYIPVLSGSKEFWEHVRGLIHATYKNIDSIPIIINGDGALWIREGATSFGKGMYQYDRFHIARMLRNVLGQENPKVLRQAQKALRENNMGKLLYVVTTTWADCQDEEQKTQLKELKDHLLANQEYIVDYRIRLKKMGFKVPHNWRSLGAAESNVNKFKNRTAKRGRAWSPIGLKAILTTLSALFEGNLQQTLSRTLREAEEWFLDKVSTGAGRLVKKAHNQSVGVKAGGFPATRNGTKGYAKLFRDLQYV